LLGLKDSRISKNGILIIKGQKYRTLEKNRNEVKKRLQEIIRLVLVQKKFRRLTKPTQISQTKRLVTKALKSRLKVLRRNVPE
jgi:ribosome-associated protein